MKNQEKKTICGIEKLCFKSKALVGTLTLALLAFFVTGCSGNDNVSLPSPEGSTTSVIEAADDSITSAETESSVSEETKAVVSTAGETEAAITTAEETSAQTETTTVTSEAEATTTAAPKCEHNFKKEILQYSTCSKEGSVQYTCTLCGFSEKKAEYVEGAENYHDYTTENIAPTCTRYGYTEYTCKNCSHKEKVVDYENKPSHKYENKVISQASESAIGQSEECCTVCGESNGVVYYNYFCDTQYYSETTAQADLAAMNLVNQLGLNDGGLSDLEKLCKLKKWYYDNTSYDSSFQRYTAYDSLVNHTSVCQGYAEALCLVLPKCGIETYMCSSDKLNHAWNLVKVNGQWTFTDFVGAIGYNMDTLIIGSNEIGRTNDTVVKEYNSASGRSYGIDFDQSSINTELRLFDLNANEITVHEEPGQYWFTIGNITWTHPYQNT